MVGRQHKTPLQSSAATFITLRTLFSPPAPPSLLLSPTLSPGGCSTINLDSRGSAAGLAGIENNDSNDVDVENGGKGNRNFAEAIHSPLKVPKKISVPKATGDKQKN